MAASGGHWLKIDKGNRAGQMVFVPKKTAKYGPPDLEAEHAKLFVPKGQTFTLAPGVTYAQGKAYYDKLNIVKAAQDFLYQGGTNAKSEVESILNDGYTQVKTIVGGIRLYNANGASIPLKNKAAIDYAKLLLGAK